MIIMFVTFFHIRLGVDTKVKQFQVAIDSGVIFLSVFNYSDPL